MPKSSSRARAGERTVHWFRNDLRLHDNTALAAAAAGADEFLLLFVLDPALLEGPGAVARGLDSCSIVSAVWRPTWRRAAAPASFAAASRSTSSSACSARRRADRLT